MTTLTAIVGNTSYDLTDRWVGEDGWGMPPTRRITDRGPQQHGDSDLDFRLDPRVGKLKLLMNDRTGAAHWTSRAELLKIFRPSRTAIALRWTFDDGTQRQFDVHYAGELGFSSSERIGFSQASVVELRAADPTCYDPVADAATFGVGSGTGAFSFPLSWPASFGGSTVNQTRAIAYLGTWRSEPIIQIRGPITNPIITNVTTGDKLDFTGTTIATGTTYTIDCRAGVKSIVDQTGTNRIDNLTDDSDLATFALEADPDAPDGINNIQVTGTSANATTEVYLFWYTRFLGI